MIVSLMKSRDSRSSMVFKPPTLITGVLKFVLGMTNEKLYQVASIRETMWVERKGRGQVYTDEMPHDEGWREAAMK